MLIALGIASAVVVVAVSVTAARAQTSSEPRTTIGTAYC